MCNENVPVPTEPTLPCSVCGEEIAAVNLVEFNDTQLCHRCYRNETVICSNCGARIWHDDNHGDETIILCSRCRYNNYNYCCHCDRLFRNSEILYDEEDEPYCYSCYDRYASTGNIYEYSYKPSPIFYGNGNRFFGVELDDR